MARAPENKESHQFIGAEEGQILLPLFVSCRCLRDRPQPTTSAEPIRSLGHVDSGLF